MEIRHSKHELSTWIIALLFFFSLTVGGFFRLYNLNWDKGHLFHPDERNIALAVTRIQFFSQLNPEFFAYGSFPIYIFRGTADALSYITNDSSWTSDWGKINVIERFYSAIFSIFTLITTFLIGKKIVSKTVGVLAMCVTAFTPILIQQAHFGVTESIITFFGTLIVLMSLKLFEHPTFIKSIAVGIIFGLSVGTKASCLTFGIIPISALLLSKKHHTSKTKQFLYMAIKGALIALVAIGVYCAVSPYTFISWIKFKESMDYEGGIVWGKLIVVYVYQFLGTKPYLYQVKQLFFTQGWLLAILSILSSVYLFIKMVRNFNKSTFIVFLWPLVYFIIVGSWYAKFVRYLVPLYPFLALAVAILVADILNRLSHKRLVPVVVLLLVCPLFLRALMQMNVYVVEQTRITASNWIYDHIGPNAKILTEHWDDGLPVPLPEQSREPGMYQSEQLTIYEPDNAEKILYYGNKLSEAEYIIINSRRLYGTLIHLSNKYPITSTYYKLLFNGKLGYQLVAEFSVYPGIHIGAVNISLNDDSSEESFQVYDHPKVLIFKNQSHYTHAVIENLLRQ